MKIGFIYFTGTYNTRYLSNIIASKFNSNKLLNDSYKSSQIDLFEVNTDFLNKTNEFLFDDYDLVGIGYPIYAFNAPKIFEQAIRLIEIKNKPYFIYKNSGEPLKFNNASSSYIKRIMKKNNNKLLGEFHLIMPYNILFPFNEIFIKQILYYNNLYSTYIVNEILKNYFQYINNFFVENKKNYINSNVFICLVKQIFKIQRLGASLNSYLYRVDKNKCNKCGLCIKNCPMSNIQYKNEYPYFNNKCTMCMRCSMNCPKNAIKIGFLNKQKVNGNYELDKIIPENSLYINSKSKGFYRYFIKYYKQLDILLDINKTTNK